MINQKENRLGEENVNHQGCLMKIIEYNNAEDIVVEFQDEYKARVHTQYNSGFKRGSVKNPYYPKANGIGIIGIKYPANINNKNTKEYKTWKGMLQRCFNNEYKEKYANYKNASCCDEWLYYENFYEWLHSQENFNKWLNGKRWAIDKDILIKGNKIYSPDTCCLVPQNVNSLFAKGDATRGSLPIGVINFHNKFRASCRNPFTGKCEYLGDYSTPSYAFLAYKKYKENLIKQVAQLEYSKGNITEKCYNAMINYEVEITD